MKEFKSESESFIDDEEKMKDFIALSKKDFLKMYSYLAEDEYEATMEILSSGYSKLQEEIENAVGQYGSDHIDIVYSENDGIYGIYHSGKNSFSVTEIYDISTASKEAVEEYCNSLGIGYCGD